MATVYMVRRAVYDEPGMFPGTGKGKTLVPIRMPEEAHVTHEEAEKHLKELCAADPDGAYEVHSEWMSWDK